MPSPTTILNLDQQIATLRQRFEDELLLQQQNSQNSQNSSFSTRFHPIDIARVRTEDWQVKRYIIDENGDLETAYSALLRTLEWKCKWGVHDNHLNRYPKEVFDLYSVELFPGGDREGRAVFAETTRGQRHYPELEQLARALVVAWAEHVDRLVGEQGVTYLMDFTGTSLLKVDLALTRFRIAVFSRHYPQLLRGRCLLHNVPRLVRSPLKLAFSFFKSSISERMTYTTSGDGAEGGGGAGGLSAYIDPARLHVDYGGKRLERVYPVPEAELASIWTLYPQLKLERKFVEKFLREAEEVCKKKKPLPVCVDGEDVENDVSQ